MRTALLACTLAACSGGPDRAPSPDEDVVATADGRVIARLQRAIHDSTRHADTCKVFHHLYAADGRQLTKGLGGAFDHHRGLFLGWNQLRSRGRTYDFWHCRRGETQQFRRFVPAAESGLDETWQTCSIHWLDAEQQPVLEELRSLRARSLGNDETALEVRSQLTAVRAPVQLDGDPQHAGHQFRALQCFAEPDANKVRYVFPASAVGGKDDVWTGCSWIAAILPMADGDVTVLRIEGPQNPGPCRWSARPYGRFGATFSTTLSPGKPLSLAWVYVIAEGARDASWCHRTAADAVVLDRRVNRPAAESAVAASTSPVR